MRILILGGDGMLGHQLLAQLGERFETRVTLRRDAEAYSAHPQFNTGQAYFGVDVRERDTFQNVLSDFQPEAVVNAVGIVKQRVVADSSEQCIEVNALFPHQLASLCKTARARLIHMSTDCVFSGDKGQYTEADESDARDLYGRTKYLGELHATHCVTLRTSIIGLGIRERTALVDWFLAQSGVIKGYERAIYSGFTTMEMSRIIERVLTKHGDLSGLWQVASRRISKYELLCKLSRKLGRKDIEIRPDDTFACDRSLLGDRFEAATGYQPPEWDDMLEELSAIIQSRYE